MMTTNVLSYLKRAAQTAPEHCALADASRDYTYAQTWRIASALAAAPPAARFWSRSTGAQEFPLLFTA